MKRKFIDIFDIFKNNGELVKVKIYPAIETENDPYEHSKTLSFLNPLTIKALVSTESFEALKWKYYGQIPSGSKKIIADKKYYNYFKVADKILIDNEEYFCWKDDSKNLMILDRTDYIVVILAKK